MWFFELGIGLVGLLLLVSPGVISRTDVDVQGEISRITDKLGNIAPPNQLMIDAFVQQVQTHCPNRTIDQTVYNEIQACMDRNFNNTELQEDIIEAIPAGKLDEVFHDMCIKWPIVKGCMKHLTDLVEDCWAKGDKVTKVMDSMVNFFCGDNNDGARIALFFADGGMKCVDDHGDGVKECIAKTNHAIDPASNDLPTEDEICGSIKQMHDCVHKGLKQCEDSTPENLVSSMLKAVAKAISCPAIHDPPPQRYTGSAGQLSGSVLIMMAGAVLINALH